MPAWCFGRDGKALTKLQPQQIRALSSALPDQMPGTSMQFERDWRRCCSTNDDRYRFLRRFSADQLQQLFKVEVKSTLLGEMIRALADCWLANAGVSQELSDRDAAQRWHDGGAESSTALGGHQCADTVVNREGQANSPGNGAVREAQCVLQLLLGLTRAGRFALGIKLLPAAAKCELQALVLELSEAAAASRDSTEGPLLQQHVDAVKQAYNVTLPA